MASLRASSNLLSSNICSSSYSHRVKVKAAAINVPNLPRTPFSAPIVHTRNLFDEMQGFTHTLPVLQSDNNNNNNNNSNNSPNLTPSKSTLMKIHAILEAVSDRVEMHHNVGEQRDNWNTLLLNSINMITLTATTMAGVAATAASDSTALKLSSALLFSAATGMLLVMNKIQPSQLAEEQRNATRLFKQLQSQIETLVAIGNPTEEDVKVTMEKVLALDRAYPLPLLGTMLEKFPKKFEPAVWWPNSSTKPSRRNRATQFRQNGWNEGLEMEMRQVIEVMKKKDIEDYERLGNLVLKINKALAIAGPLLSGIAAVGSCFVGQGSWTAIVPVMAGALAAAVNSFEHGGQVGMVSEMYRSTAGFFKLTESSIQETIQQEVDNRENGELFEMKLALKLGRSLSQLRDLARKSAYSRVEGTAVDEFASNIF